MPTVYTLADIAEPDEMVSKSHAEFEYRRAYRDGWIEAAMALQALVSKGQTDGRAVYDLLFSFWDKELAAWQRSDCSGSVPPPDMPIQVGSRSKRVRKLVYERCGGVCGICHKQVDPTNWHLDHIVPLSRGGTDSEDNLQVAHPHCNYKKSND